MRRMLEHRNAVLALTLMASLALCSSCADQTQAQVKVTPEFNYAGDIGPIFVSEISDGAAKPRAEIRHARSACDLASTRQFVRRCQSAVVILVMRKQILRSQIIKMTATYA